MRVKDLIKQLQKVNPELDVLISVGISEDTFSVFEDIGTHLYKTDHGEIEVWEKSDWKKDNEGDVYPGDNCVVLWP